nr:immunoglobulin light chain junction region [Macaca mulatta]MOY15429.1 immunoglobulin light chain junction region [Macaca mulatta]MOY15830.1 immunoglobulin light chain junction region [Macaca mulatta]MOY16002.1 immunoglobulin light chain junction region [Macaca mulatta]MOY16319.1 immunoglobulin light chain junction region [Macaca mulatta]
DYYCQSFDRSGFVLF